MTYVDPLMNIARGSQLIDGWASQRAQRQAGQRIAAGDFSGGADALFGAGQIANGIALQAEGRAQQKAQIDARTAQRELEQKTEAEQIAFTRQAVRALKGAEDPLAQFDAMIPAFRQLGTDDAQIAQLRQGLATGGAAFLDQIEQIANQQARQLEIQNLGNGYGVVVDKTTGEKVNEFRAPAGIRDANGVIYNDQTGAIIQDTRPPEYIQRDPEKDLIEISPGGGAQPPADGRQPRGIRNNNPGNIEDGPFARSLPGYKGSDGRFAIFETPEQGNAAKTRLLQSYVQRGFDTPAEIINRWAPPSDNNPTGAYVAYVARRAGIGPNDKVTPDKIEVIAQAIAEFENGNTQQASQGGPRVIAAGQQQISQQGILTPEQVQAAGLRPGTVAQSDENGKISILQAGADRSAQANEAADMANNLRTGLAGARRYANVAGVWSSVNPLNRQARANLEAHLTTLKGNITFSQLMEMKRNSPTGASGLGALSDGEARMLASTVAALDADMAPRELERSLAVIERLASRLEAPAGGPRLRFQPNEAQIATARRIDTGAAMQRGARLGSREHPLYINPNDPSGSYGNVRSGQYFITPDGQLRGPKP